MTCQDCLYTPKIFVSLEKAQQALGYWTYAHYHGGYIAYNRLGEILCIDERYHPERETEV